MFLKNETIPDTHKAIFQKIADLTVLDSGFINPLFRLLEKNDNLYREELWQLMEDYINQIEKLTNYIDHM